jgi:hypothetical protein
MAIIARTVLKKVEMDSYIKRDFLDKSFNRSGLCAYCTRKVTCCLNDTYGLVFDCDDYDAGDEASCSLTFTTLDMCCEDESSIYGLCVGCQNRDICQLKRINGGIWHCDEYQ